MGEDIEKELMKLPPEMRYQTGVWKTTHGECPRGGFTPMACMFCPYGHMLECHYPMTCEEAQCDHYLQEMEEEY
ncbi:MAG: hypothetical protein ACE5Z5_12545 [Candidatus Bathyarchaeia archaeon]